MRRVPSQPVWVALLVTLIIWAGGCASNRYGVIENGPTASPEEAVYHAVEYLRDRPDWRIDCSHFVLACYHSRDMDNYLRHHGNQHNLTYTLNTYLTLLKTRRSVAAQIEPGDIIIFNKTYDINHDGHIDDKDVYTHAAIVESYHNGLLIYIDCSDDRKTPRIHRREFSFFDDKYNETVARDPATGRKIHARETFYAAYAVH
jgi:hypothetical protein